MPTRRFWKIGSSSWLRAYVDSGSRGSSFAIFTSKRIAKQWTCRLIQLDKEMGPKVCGEQSVENSGKDRSQSSVAIGR